MAEQSIYLDNNATTSVTLLFSKTRTGFTLYIELAISISRGCKARVERSKEKILLIGAIYLR